MDTRPESNHDFENATVDRTTEYELGNYKDALAFMLKGESIGLADKPAFVTSVHYHAALVYLRFSDFAAALEQLRPLAKAGHEPPEVIQALGLSALEMKTLPANLPVAKRPLVEAAGRAASAYLAERAEESGPLFDQLVARFPADPGVHYMYGVFLLGHDPAASSLIQSSLKLLTGILKTSVTMKHRVGIRVFG